MRNNERGAGLPGLLLAILLAVVFLGVIGWLNLQRYAGGGGDFDLGIVSQILWNTSQGRLAGSTVPGLNGSFFAEHVDLVYIPLAALYRLSPDPRWLLWAQTAVMAVAIPLVWLATRPLAGTVPAAALTLAYALGAATHYIIFFDFHPVTLTVPLYLAVYVAWRRRYRKLAAALLVASLGIDESMSVVMMAFAAFLALQRRWRMALGWGLLGLAWYGAVIFWVMPAAAAGKPPLYFFTTYLSYLPGASGSEKAVAAVCEPWRVVQQGLARETFAYLGLLVLGFGGLPLLAPRWFVIMAPQLLFNVFSGFEGTRSIHQHYSATLLPFLILAAAEGGVRLQRMVSWRGRALPAAAVAGMVLAGMVLVHGIDSPHPGIGTRDFIVPGDHSPARFQQAQELMRLIPGSASVATELKYWAYLSLRRELYVFYLPHPPADYCLLDLADNVIPPGTPCTAIGFARKKIEEESYTVVAFHDGILLLRRPERP